MYKLFFLVLTVIPFSAEAASLLHMFGNDYVGAQTEYKITAAITAREVTSGNNKAIEVTVANADHNFTLDFAAPAGQNLKPGKYLNAERFPFNAAGKPGLSVSGDGRGCNQVQGSFYVKQLAKKADGTVKAFAADFIQFCDNAVEPLKGSIRVNSVVKDNIFEVLAVNDGPFDLKHGILYKAKKRVGAEVRRRGNVKYEGAKLEVSVKAGAVSITAKRSGFTTFSKTIPGATRAFIVSKGTGIGVYVANVRTLSKVSTVDFAAKDFPLADAGGITVDLLPY